MLITEKKIEEIIDVIGKPDLLEMMDKYKKMVKDWASYVNLKLNNDYIKCPITLYNEFYHAHERLKLINDYQSHIEYCSVLQGIIEDGLE